jgi:hypothetical protein
VNPGAFGDVDDQIDIGVIVMIRASWNLDVSVSHTDVFRVDFKIFWRRHHGEFDGPLRPERFVTPLSY